MQWITVATALLVSPSIFCGNVIDPDFLAWMNANLQPWEVAKVVRDDVVTGSFGGGVYNGDSTDRPLIMVHGLNNEAGTLYPLSREFVAMGYPTQRIFASTWGRGAETFNPNVTLNCEAVQDVRRVIQVVLAYTGASQVDVAGYSMGSPLARKAILGGSCVDNSSVNLGAPLTSQIHNFLSIAGANQGALLCTIGFTTPICNLNNGLGCSSAFLNDINNPSNPTTYERSSNSFYITSTTDEVVGYRSCLFTKKSSQFAGAAETKINGKSHTQTEYDTADIQLPLLRQ